MSNRFFNQYAGAVSALDASTGALLWHNNNVYGTSSVAVVNGMVYTEETASHLPGR